MVRIGWIYNKDKTLRLTYPNFLCNRKKSIFHLFNPLNPCSKK